MLPHFAAPAKMLDAIDVRSLTRDEQLTFSALVGQVNRRRPRIALLNRRSEEGRDTWLRTSTVDLQIGEPFDDRNKYELIAKYAGEVSGVVMYDRRAEQSHAEPGVHRGRVAKGIARHARGVRIAWRARHRIAGSCGSDVAGISDRDRGVRALVQRHTGPIARSGSL